MDFRVETKELQRVIGLLGVVAKSNAVDFTGRIIIEADEDGKVLFVANNNSTAITILSDKAEVTKPGSATVLFGELKSFVNALTPWNEDYGAKDVHIEKAEVVEVSVEIVHENGEKSTGGLKLEYYEDMRLHKPKPFGEAHFVLNSNMFKKAVSKVLYAMDPTEQRSFIQGMCLTFAEDDIFFCGTNGRILSEYKVKNSNELSGEIYLMMYSFIMGLRRAVGEETQVFFEVDGRDIRAKFDDVCFSGRLFQGREYPDYKKVLETYKNEIKIDKNALMDLLLPFSDLLDSEDNNRLTFEISGGKMKIYNEKATFKTDFDLGYNDGFAIDVNGKFLYQTVEAIHDDIIAIKFSDEKGVFIFDSGNFEDQKALVTPIRRR